jgi:predicted alpha/beta superfamily hydrolase
VSGRYQQVTIQDTEIHRLSSTHVDQEYNILVALPPGYVDSDKTYPTLYTTDGDLVFGAVTQIARLVAKGKTIPQLVVVGIGYPVHWTKTSPYRERDYIPEGWHQSHPLGCAGNFLRFVCEELIPWVGSEYRVDPEDRCYGGDSHAGLFGLYTLLTRPEAFSRYLIGSPTIYHEDPEVFRCECDYAATHSDLRARVCMYMGQLEDETQIANTRRLCQTLEGRGYDGLHLNLRVFEGQTHQSVIPYCYRPHCLNAVWPN